MTILHKLAHLLNMHSYFFDYYAENDWIMSCRRCNTCGKADDPIKMGSLQDYPILYKFIDDKGGLTTRND